MWPYGDSGLLHWTLLDVSWTRTNPEVFAPPWLWLSQRGSHFLDSCHKCRTSPTDKPAQGTATPSACGAAGDSTGKMADMHTCLAELSMEIESNFSQEAPDAGQLSSCVGPLRAQLVDEDLQAAVDFFKMPPPLLSPVPSPPLASLPPWGSLTSPLGPVSATPLCCPDTETRLVGRGSHVGALAGGITSWLGPAMICHWFSVLCWDLSQSLIQACRLRGAQCWALPRRKEQTCRHLGHGGVYWMGMSVGHRELLGANTLWQQD